jgi:hypothetical protein
MNLFRAAASVACLAMTLTTPLDQAKAQQNVRVLSPTADTCLAYTQAMNSNDHAAVSGFAGWAIGYLSGKAVGTGVDFLNNASAMDLIRQLDENCLRTPQKPLSVATEELARSLIAAQPHQ